MRQAESQHPNPIICPLVKDCTNIKNIHSFRLPISNSEEPIILLIIGGHYLLGFLPAVLEQKEKMNSAYSMLPQPPGYEKYATRYYRKGFHIGYEITYVTDKETNDEEKVWNFYEFYLLKNGWGKVSKNHGAMELSPEKQSKSVVYRKDTMEITISLYQGKYCGIYLRSIDDWFCNKLTSS